MQNAVAKSKIMRKKAKRCVRATFLVEKESVLSISTA